MDFPVFDLLIRSFVKLSGPLAISFTPNSKEAMYNPQQHWVALATCLECRDSLALGRSKPSCYRVPGTRNSALVPSGFRKWLSAREIESGFPCDRVYGTALYSRSS